VIQRWAAMILTTEFTVGYWKKMHFLHSARMILGCC
jgi:hypothetical protein